MSVYRIKFAKGIEVMLAGDTDRASSFALGILGSFLRATDDATDAVVQAALEQLGVFVGADRASLVRMRPESATNFIHDWAADGISPMDNRVRDLVLAMPEEWRSSLCKAEPVIIPDLAMLPKHLLERASSGRRNVHALVLLPVVEQEHLFGVVILEAMRSGTCMLQNDFNLLKPVTDGIIMVWRRADVAQDIKRSQAESTAVRNRLQAMLDAMPDIVGEVDADGRYTYMHSGRPEELLDPVEEMIGKTVEEALPADVAAQRRELMRELDTGARAESRLYQFDTALGMRWFHLSAARRAALGPDDRDGYLFISRDVSREVEQQHVFERLSEIAKRSNNLVIVIDAQGRVEWVNKTYELHTGYSLDEIRGKLPRPLLQTAKTNRTTKARIRAALCTSEPVTVEVLNRKKDGEAYWVHLDINPLLDGAGQHSGLIGIMTDITERKLKTAELEARTDEAVAARQRLNDAIDALGEGFVLFDADDRLVMCNRRYKEFYAENAPSLVPGTSFENILRDALTRRQPLEAKGREEAWLFDRMSGHRTGEIVHEQSLIDGRVLRVTTHRTLRGESIAVYSDITDLKQAEQRLLNVIKGAQVGTWEWTLETGVNAINDRWAEMLGYNRGELEPVTIRTFRALLHPDNLQNIDQPFELIFSGQSNRFEQEFRMRHKQGHWVWILSRGSVTQYNSDGAVEALAGVHSDITEIKQAEQRLLNVIEGAQVGTWEWGVTTNTHYVNEKWAAMLGYSRAELDPIAYKTWQGLIHPEDLSGVEEKMQLCMVAGFDTFETEYRLRHKAGHWLWVMDRARVISRGADGAPEFIAGVLIDISDRTELHAQLKESHRKMNEDMQAAAAIQLLQMPKDNVVGALQLSSFFRPSRLLSGDTFDFVPDADGCATVFQIDVEGHGAAAGFVSVAAHIAVKQAIQQSRPTESLARLVADVNRQWSPHLNYFTMLIARIDPKRRRCTFVQAGHPPLIFLNSDKGVRVPGNGGLPIGVLEDATYEEETVTFGPKDRLILITDGVYEAANPAGTLYSEARFLTFLNGRSHKSTRVLLDEFDEALREWRGSETLEDDAMIVVIEGVEPML